MSYYKDAMFQLDCILKYSENEEIITFYKKEIEQLFCGIYMINYMSNRIEYKGLFDSDYFNVSFSCIIEAFSLILNNYPRGASLVLRSSLENFIKFIIQATNNGDFKIDDRRYTANKVTLDKIIEIKYSGALKSQSISLNSSMESEYSILSGLSHSLTPESKNNKLEYFSDLRIINEEYIYLVLKMISKVIIQIFSFSIIMCQPSLRLWDSLELEKILRMVFGKRKTKTFLELIKS